MDSQNRLLSAVNQVQNELLSHYVAATMNLFQDVENHLEEQTVAMDLLLQRFNDPEISTYILGHFRLLCSSWLKQHAESRGYNSFIPSSMGIDGYCTYFLEAPNQELDSLAMTLLVDMLLEPAMFTMDIQNPEYDEIKELNCKGVESTGEFADSLGAATIHLLHYRTHYAILYHPKVHLEDLLLLIPGFYPALPSYHFLPPQNNRLVDNGLTSSTSKLAPFVENTPLLDISSKQEPLAVFASTDNTFPVLDSADSPVSDVCDSTRVDVPSSRPDVDCDPDFGNIAASELQNEAGIDNSKPIAVLKSNYTENMTDSESVSSIDEISLSDTASFQTNSTGDLEKDPCGLVKPILDPMELELVERIMSEFWIVFKRDWTITIRRCVPTPTPSDPCRGSTSQGGATSQQTSNTEQRKRKEDNKEDDEDFSDENDRRNPKRPRKAMSMLATILGNKRFACPYRKHDPELYNVQHWRSCALTSLENISRVKLVAT